MSAKATPHLQKPRIRSSGTPSPGRLPGVREFLERTYGHDALDAIEATTGLFKVALQYRLVEMALATPDRNLRQRLKMHQETFAQFAAHLLGSDDPERESNISDLELLQQAVAATATRLADRRKPHRRRGS